MVQVNQEKLIDDIKKQITFCMIKPDGVNRGLTGEIISKIESVGLRIVALKMLQATESQIQLHYPLSDQCWMDTINKDGLTIEAELPVRYLSDVESSQPHMKVEQKFIDYMQSGPVVCMVVKGVQAIDMIRKLAGHTLPFKAEMGTIRGDYSVDSLVIANLENRSVHNIFHVSETANDVKKEIENWFAGDSII